MNKNSGIIKHICEISAILSHQYMDQIYPKMEYFIALSVITDTSVSIFKRLEDTIKKESSDEWIELYDTFNVISFRELISYLGGKHIRENLLIEVSDEIIE